MKLNYYSISVEMGPRVFLGVHGAHFADIYFMLLDEYLFISVMISLITNV